MPGPRVFQLQGSCNNYPWGKTGRESRAARYCAATPGTDFRIQDDEHYSEMWFGDYPDYPARVLETGELLKDVLDKNRDELLGAKVVEKLGAQLPFLPKVLSIAKALPLQLHPDKELAAKLHEEDPDNFTDPNHKPEIAVALTRFEVFIGFKALDDIAQLFRLPSLRDFVPAGTGGDTWSDQTLRETTRAILKADEATIRRAQDRFADEVASLRSASAAAREDAPPLSPAAAATLSSLLPRLWSQYGPRDPGALVAAACMNYLVFEPGDAVYIPADGVHAYLSGDIVECMARSNNVLNAGFCPPADRNSADLFADALTFRNAGGGRGDVQLPARADPSKGKKGKTVVYRPPLREFDLLRTDLGAGESEEIAPSEGPGTLVVTSGRGTMKAEGKTFELREGFVYFVAPGVAVSWETDQGLQVHMAYV